MEIRLPVRVSTTSPLQTEAQALKLGDILRAVVETRLKDNAFQLRLDSGGRALVAYSGANLKPGQILELEVVKLETTPELRILPRSTELPASDSTVQQALRLFLPKQKPLAHIIPELQQLAAQARQSSSLPAPITEALESFLASIPRKSDMMSPEGLEKWCSNSGLFLEAKLAAAVDSSADFIDSDLKARLLRVLDSLKTLRANPKATPEVVRVSTSGTPPTAPHARENELSAAPRTTLSAPDGQLAVAPGNEVGIERITEKVEAALARVVTDQLASLPGNTAAALVWHLEIPFTDGQHHDAARLLVAKDAESTGTDGTDCWSLTLELHPPGLGTFCARILLKDERIDVYLWNDTATTSDLIREQCERLNARLHGVGLTVGQLTALNRPPDSLRSENPFPPLLDLRA